MTRIGDTPEPYKAQPHKDLEFNANRFLNALQSYQSADPEDQARLKSVMDDSMALMRAAVKEIKQKGIYKQEQRVEKDYALYLQSNTPAHLTLLEEDLSTLRDYNKLSNPDK